MTAIQQLVVALIQSLQKVLQLVSHYGNATISIPIFSALYKMIAHSDLTAFDAIALLIAIPTTIFTKLVTGSSPPQIPKLDSALLDGLIFKDSPVKVTPQMHLDFNTLTAGLTVSASFMSTIVNLIKLLYASGTDGASGALETVTKGAFLTYFSVILDMFSALNSLPTDASLPGLEYRKWVRSPCSFHRSNQSVWVN